jgi:histidinol phosphatase-like enzyme
VTEIVVVMGFNASGKSTLVQEFVGQGYTRLNRDLMGGTIAQQAQHAAEAVKKGSVVLDNTYPTVESRKSIIAAGKQAGVPVRCVWLTTSFEDAQFNACMRMMERAGRILGPEDFKKSKEGYMLLGASNQSAIAKGLPEAKAIACFTRTNELLDQDIDVQFCSHSVPPVVCYCRKPSSAMGVTHIWRHKLMPSECIVIGDKTEDKTFATRCGFQFVQADEFFK